MNNHLRFASALVIVGGGILFGAQAYGDTCVVIGNRSIGTAHLSATDLKKAFTGRIKQWDNGAVVQTVISTKPASPEMTCLAQILSIDARSLLTHMQQEVFKGEMRRPVTVASSAEVIAAVARSAGGVGCISAAAATKLPSSVVIIQITH